MVGSFPIGLQVLDESFTRPREALSGDRKSRAGHPRDLGAGVAGDEVEPNITLLLGWQRRQRGPEVDLDLLGYGVGLLVGRVGDGKEGEHLVLRASCALA